MTQGPITVTVPELEVGRVQQLTDSPSTDFRRSSWTCPPDTPPPRTPPIHRGRGGGDDGKPSRLELLLLRLVRASTWALVIADVLLLGAIVAGALARKRAR